MTINKREERIELTAVDKFSTVIGQAQTQFKGLGASIDTVKNALAAMGVVLGVGAMAKLAADMVSATAAFDDMAESTGASVEQLSRLSAVAKVHGADMGAVNDGLTRLTRGLKGTKEETQNATAALNALGIQTRTATGQLRDPGELMQEIAVKLSRFEDGAGKTAVALDLFGKSGARLLPYLKDLATAGEYGGRVTKEQAAAAEQLENNLRRLRSAAEFTGREFMMSLTPPLVAFTEQLMAAQKAGFGLAGALQQVLRFKFGVGGGSPMEIIEDANRGLAALRREGESASRTPGWLGGRRWQAQVYEDVNRLEARKRFALEMLGTNAAGLEDDLSGTVRGPAAMPRLNYTGRKDDPKKPTGRTLADVLGEGAGMSTQGVGDIKLLLEGWRSGVLTLEEYQAAFQRVIEKQQFHKDLLAQQAEATKRFTEEILRQEAAQEKQAALYADFHTSTGQRLRDIEFETTLVGADNAEREKAVAFRQIELDLDRAMVEATPEVQRKLMERAEAMRQSIGAAIDAKVAREKAHDAATKAAEEWKNEFKRQSESIERLLSDALMRGFEDGKGWARNFADTLKNLFRTLVLEPIIRPIAQAGAGALLGAFGMPAGAAGVFTPGGGIGGGGLGFPSPSSFLNFGGGFEFLGGLASGFGSSAATTAALIESGTVGFAGAGLEAAAGIGGFGPALGPIGLGLGALALLGAFGEGGGPKQQEVLWNAATLGFGDNNITSQDPAYYAAAAAYTRQLHEKYGAEALRKVPTISVSGEPGSDPFALLQRVGQQVESALAPELQNKQAQAAMRGSLLAAQDPTGYWSGQLAQLQADLGTSADSLAEWRMEFLEALEQPLSAELFAKWQALGAAIEGVAGVAGGAATVLSTSNFRTLVDYRRAVRRAGGVPQFAAGGEHAGGWRMVGERGTELEFTAPSAIVSHQDAKGLLDMRPLVAGFEGMRTEIRAMAVALARNTGELARLARRWENNGLPVRALDPTQPILVRETPA